MAHSVDPDDTPHSERSHLGLHCLLRSVCPNTYGKYGRLKPKPLFADFSGHSYMQGSMSSYAFGQSGNNKEERNTAYTSQRNETELHKYPPGLFLSVSIGNLPHPSHI